MKNNPLLLFFLYFFLARSSKPLDQIIEGTFVETLVIRLVQLFSFGFIFYFLTKRNQNKQPLIIVGSIAVSLTLSTFISGSLYHCISYVYPMIAYACFLVWIGLNWKRFRVFIKVVSNYYYVIASINLFQIIFLPNLFGEYYFLGGENLVGYTFVIGFMYNALEYYFTERRIKLLGYLALLIANDLLIWSGGTLIGLAVLLACMYIPVVNKFINKFSLSLLALGYAGVFIVVVLLNSTGILDGTFVEYLVVDVLGKDMTFSARTFLWVDAIMLISQRPILGHGVPVDGNIIQFVTFQGRVKDLSAHNQILQSMYEGGFLILILLIISIIHLSRNLKDCRVNYINILFKSLLLAILFMYLTEAPSLHPYLELFVMGTVTTFVFQNQIKYSKDEKIINNCSSI